MRHVCQVSNAFGSNIFDMLLGLGLPWFLQMSAVDQGATLYVGQPEVAAGGGLVPRGLNELRSSLYMLLITVLAWLIVCGCFYNWRIFPTMGYFMCTYSGESVPLSLHVCLHVCLFVCLSVYICLSHTLCLTVCPPQCLRRREQRGRCAGPNRLRARLARGGEPEGHGHRTGSR